MMQVLDVVKHRPEVRKISFVAHSLGGLVARYAIGRLYEHSSELGRSGFYGNSLMEEHTNSSMQYLEQPCEDRIAGLQPMNFITFATPHLGSRGHKQVSSLLLHITGVNFFDVPAVLLVIDLQYFQY